MENTTVVYYSSNQEDIVFESKIQANIWKNKGSLPLISVTQKPVRFGENICIGEVDVNEQSLWRQMLIGCAFAKTPYVIFCEADTLYPPEYFTHVPSDINARYWFEPVYIFYKDPVFHLKGRSDCAHMAGREYIKSILENGLNNNLKSIYSGFPRPYRVDLATPVVSIKTGRGMRQNTQNSHVDTYELPLWGTAEAVKKELGL